MLHRCPFLGVARASLLSPAGGFLQVRSRSLRSSGAPWQKCKPLEGNLLSLPRGRMNDFSSLALSVVHARDIRLSAKLSEFTSLGQRRRTGGRVLRRCSRLYLHGRSLRSRPDLCAAGVVCAARRPAPRVLPRRAARFRTVFLYRERMQKKELFSQGHVPWNSCLFIYRISIEIIFSMIYRGHIPLVPFVFYSLSLYIAGKETRHVRARLLVRS